MDAREYLASQPPERRVPNALEGIRERVVAGGRRTAVLDDPTGTQTVHCIPVLTTWTVKDLRRALELRVLPEESAFPGLPCIVFAGNVGGPDSLAEVIQIPRGD